MSGPCARTNKTGSMTGCINSYGGIIKGRIHQIGDQLRRRPVHMEMPRCPQGNLVVALCQPKTVTPVTKEMHIKAMLRSNRKLIPSAPLHNGTQAI